MKKLYFIVLSAAFVLASAAATAKIYDGGIKLTNVRIAPAGEQLNLKITIEVEERAVTSLRGMAIVPFVSDGTFEADFPYALVNGKNRHNIFTRHKKFRYERLMANLPVQVMKVDKKSGSGTIEYEASIHHDAWMDAGALFVRYVLISPAGELQYYTAGLAGFPVSGQAPAPKHECKAAPTPTPEPVPVPTPEPKKIHKYSGSAYLDFEVGQSTLLPDYMRNKQEFAIIKKSMDDVVDNPTARNISVIVTGYASPEGRYSSNDELALARATALEKHLQIIYGKRFSVSKVLSGGEGWSGLRDLVEGSTMPEKRRVLAIIDGVDFPDEKESKLRKMDGGAVWQTLLNDFFPRLRRVDYDILYELEE